MRSARYTPAPLALAVAFSVALAVGHAPLAHARSGSTAGAAPVSIKIPAQPLGQALNTLARQAKLRMSFPAALVANKTAPAVSGKMTARQALDRLLAGSGLTASIEGSAVVVQQAPPPANAPAQTDATLPPVTVSADAAGADQLVTQGRSATVGKSPGDAVCHYV